MGRGPGRRVTALTLALALVLPVLAAPAPALADVAAPVAPIVVSPAPSALITPTITLVCRVDSSTTDVRVSGATVVTSALSASDSLGATYAATITVPYGRRSILIAAGNAGGWSPDAVLTVWQLHYASSRTQYVLVDKSDFMLYVVRSGRVIAAYPVATGMPGYSTPTGTFLLGRPQPPGAGGAVWGPFRMRLHKRAWVRKRYTVRVNGRRVVRWHRVLGWVRTRYYIHGTNEPDSIGTPASHGCVRLWNANLRRLARLTVWHERAVIRP